VSDPVLAIDRGDVADYVQVLATVYLVLIFIRVIIGWVPRMPYNPVLSGAVTFVSDVTDPYLNLFRRFLPPVRMGPAALDLSPIIGAFVLIIAASLIVPVIRG
jgi:YggT family protein